MQCYDKPYKVVCKITSQQRYIFEYLQANFKHESAGACIFDKKGNLLKFNVFMGGTTSSTWGHGHIVFWHTHPTKSTRLYSPPSFIDIRSMTNSFFNNKLNLTDNILYSVVGLVFAPEGCWVYRPNRFLIAAIKRIKKLSKNDQLKEKKKLVNKIAERTRILSIHLIQPQNYKNLKKYKKINVNEYCRKMGQLSQIKQYGNKRKTKGGKKIGKNECGDSIGFCMKLFRPGVDIKLPGVYQCLESLDSPSRMYTIPPNVELKLINSKN